MMRARPEPISVREIEMQLRALVEDLVRECLPNAIREGDFLRVGSIGGEKGQSLAVTLCGRSRGMWTDFSANQSGDCLTMIALTKFGGNLGEAVAYAKSWLRIDDLDPNRLATMRAEGVARDAAADAQAEREAEAKKRGARALWLNGQPLSGVCPASRYLAARGIDVDQLGKWPGSLRYHAEVWNRDAGVKLPCLVAQMITPDGVQVATHRTWLGRRADGVWDKADKAGVTGPNGGVPRGSAKKILGKSGGAFISLRKGASKKAMGSAVNPETIYVTEGIEDALTVAMVKPELRVIAGYSLRNLGMIRFPAAIETIVIVADRDAAPAGADAAELRKAEDKLQALEKAIARQQARGHRVQTVMPPPGYKDMNEWWQATDEALAAEERMAAAAAAKRGRA